MERRAHMSNNKRNTSRNYASTKKQPNAEQTEIPVEEPVVVAEPEEVEAPVEEPVVKKAKVHGVDTGLRLRKSPSVRGEVESILKPGVDLEIVKELGDWTQVKVEATGLIGYVMTQFIEVV